MRIGFRKPGLVFVVYLRRQFSLEVWIRRVGFGFWMNPKFEVWHYWGPSR
jgi:hypothetical protein